VSRDRAAEILDGLRRRGVRITSARRAVVTALVGTDGHVTAEDIARLVQRSAPDVHLSTVYRTLESLEASGVVDHVHLGHGRAVYHLTADRHQHLVCEHCRKVVHLPVGLYDDLAAAVEQRYRFELRPHHFALIGVCEDCRRAFDTHEPPSS
jgi:Fe2+ or Zn2+ uptake regulation protein